MSVELENRGKEESIRKLLFRTEMMVLQELVEVLVPVLSLIISFVVRQWSPNKDYFRNLGPMTDEEYAQSQWNLLLLIALDVFGLIFIFTVLEKYCHAPVRGQLMFNIGHHRQLYMLYLAFFFIAANSLSLVHLGHDYGSVPE